MRLATRITIVGAGGEWVARTRVADALIRTSPDACVSFKPSPAGLHLFAHTLTSCGLGQHRRARERLVLHTIEHCLSLLLRGAALHERVDLAQVQSEDTNTPTFFY